jgi:hypothetical protein
MLQMKLASWRCASDTTNGKAAANMPSRMRATGDVALPVRSPATTTLVSMMTACRLTTCAAPPAHAPAPLQVPGRRAACCVLGRDAPDHARRRAT